MKIRSPFWSLPRVRPSSAVTPVSVMPEASSQESVLGLCARLISLTIVY